MVGTVKLKLDLTRKEITSDYVFETLFRISKKSDNIDFSNDKTAKELVILALTRGEDGFYAEDWSRIIKEKGLSESQYFSILKTLKAAGILRKTKGKYYTMWDFPDHLSAMAAAFNTFYMQHGKVRK